MEARALSSAIGAAGTALCESVLRQEAGLPPGAPITDNAMVVLREVVSCIQGGGDLRPHYANLERLIHSQKQRAEVIDSLLLTSEYGRMVSLMEARNRIEQILVGKSLRPDLTIDQQASLHSFLNNLVRQVGSRIQEGALPMSDVVATVRKMANPGQDDDGASARLKGTSAQGREIVRQLALRVARAVAESAGREEPIPVNVTTEERSP